MAESDRNAGKPLFSDPFEDLDRALIEDYFDQSGSTRSIEEAPPKQGVDVEQPVDVSFETVEKNSEPEEQLGDDEAPGRIFEPETPIAEQEPESEVAGMSEDFLLESLIASIDSGVSRVFGTGMLTDLARDSQSQVAGLQQYVIFTLDDSEYAVHIDNVTEISEWKEITSVPNVPSWVLGVTNLRGEIISMVDLSRFLGLKSDRNGNQSERLMVVQSTNGAVRLALVVDRVNGIRYLDLNHKIESGAPIDDEITPYLQAVCEQDGRMLAVLDFDNALLPQLSSQF